MTLTMLLVFLILFLTLVLLVSGRVPLEVVAFLVMGSLPVLGLISPAEAVAGFSSPAVITLWAIFILSAGLTRVGVGDLLGRQVLRLAGTREASLVALIMSVAALLSAIMNNVAVTALMLPVVMDIARQTALPPSRLLMPLAYGSLLGGLTTQIGTPPNILVSAAMDQHGLGAFGMFDFTPVGGAILLVGIAFMVLGGRHLLPRRDPAGASASQDISLRDRYDLRQRMFLMRLPPYSELAGKTLEQCRFGPVLGLSVLEILRDGRTLLAPGPQTPVHGGDRLLVQGRLERMEELRGWRELALEQEGCGPDQLIGENIQVARAEVAADSELLGKGLRETRFFHRFGANLLGVRRDAQHLTQSLEDYRFSAGDSLLLQGPTKTLAELDKEPAFDACAPLGRDDLMRLDGLQGNLLTLRLGPTCSLAGRSLNDSALGDALGLRVLAILRETHQVLLPKAEDILHAEDRLAVTGQKADLRLLQALEGLEVQRELGPGEAALESADIGLMEVVLSPHSRLAGKTLRDLHFREKFGLSVIALWREGRAHRTGLRDVPLRFGDALLIYGPRARFSLLARDPDFLVLTQGLQEAPRRDKLVPALLILTAVLVPVLLGLQPIYLAAVLGAAAMILCGCLTMSEAHRAIEWKAVFLIAGLLPLGTALEQSGAAHLLAESLVALTIPLGPYAVLGGLVLLTALGTCFLPPPALIVLLMPVVFGTAAQTGLSPHALAMGVAMASASLMSPFSHPANILVMGPGGYGFRDYLKVGLPLTLVVLATLLLVLPRIWPLQG
ncbi:SLC13 family permease [Geoalkalibacter sp.]|uniref:SLC13 family permease n=1 Tax=Geoalkalibacter sp. TaxID=3041440 RepID=UPI00272E8953|nr:SLC13 family permease [Geoalkalibacter sp.]